VYGTTRLMAADFFITLNKVVKLKQMYFLITGDIVDNSRSSAFEQRIL